MLPTSITLKNCEFGVYRIRLYISNKAHLQMNGFKKCIILFLTF